MYPYFMQGQSLKTVEHQLYLGITLTESLSWKSHILNVKNKANKTLGFIKHNLSKCPEDIKAQAYKSLVRPILEYSSIVWDPYRAYQKAWLEQIQRRAARFVTNTHSREEGCVTRALEHLRWPTLEARGRVARLTMMYKTFHNHAAVDIPEYVQHQTYTKTRYSHPMKFIPIQTSCDTYKFSYWPRTIIDWNNLTPMILESTSVNSFNTAVSNNSFI